MANLGPIQVPDKLAPALPYVKAVIAALGVIASVLVVVLGAGTPAYVYVVISAVTLLGVYMVPNGEVKAVLQDGLAAVTDGSEALAAAKVGDVVTAEADVKKAVAAADNAVVTTEAVVKQVVEPILPTPPVPPASGVIT